MSQFKPEISYIRVFSMLIVIVTHYLSWVNVYTFQINTIAVSAFLFISGCLYGNKSIDDRKNWIKNRINRVLVPFWILAATFPIYFGEWAEIVERKNVKYERKNVCKDIVAAGYDVRVTSNWLERFYVNVPK